MLDLDTLLEQEPIWLALAGGAVAVVVIVLLLVIFLPRGRKQAKTTVGDEASPAPSAEALFPVAPAASVQQSAPRPARPRPPITPAMASTATIRSDFSRGKKDWMRRSGKPAVGVIDQDAYHLRADEGVVSRESLSATAGAIYELSFTVLAASDATNGGAPNFFAGPVFLDGDGRVMRSWKEQPEIRVSDGPRTAAVKSRAPEGAATVHMGIHGSFVKGGVSGDGAVAFSRLELRQI